MAICYNFDIDEHTFANAENIEILKEAARELFSASEEDFEQMKSQNWYKRTWQMITFSKDNEKVMAKNITSLAKAQDIVLKLLLSLSDDNKEIALIVSELSGKIYNLANATEVIAQKVIVVDNFIKYGYKKSGSIDDFSDAQKSVLISTFNYIADSYGHIEEMAMFLTAIRRMAKFNERNTEFDIETFIFDDKESRVIFPILIEMNYFCTKQFDLCDEISEIIDHLSISAANKKKIKELVELDIKRVGINGIIELYYDLVPDYEISDSDIEFEDDFFESNYDEFYPRELTEITISNIMHIAKDEIKKFINNKIYVSSFIDCAGTMVFENCEIYYNVTPGTPCQITLKEGSSLSIINCKVTCNNLEKNAFFKDEGSVRLFITNSIFEDCSYFIEKEKGDDCNFVMQGCEIINPYTSFLSIYGVNEGIINNCIITFNKPLPEDDDNYYKGSIFSVSPKWGETNNIRVSDVIVNGNNLFNVKDEKGYFNRIKDLFNMNYASYTNCTFENVNYCIRNVGILSHCKFNKCEKVIENGVGKEKSKITHCTFTGCESIIIGNNMDISNCQFVECNNNLIETSFGGNVNVEFCEFYNIKYSKPYSYSTPACLCFHRSKGSEYSSSSVKKCIFNGIELNDGFLIAGMVIEKINGKSVYVEECSFQNCTTKRESGKIIKCYGIYFNVFKKQIEIEVTSIQNCLGLDKVNKENGYINDVIVKAKDSTGAVIGATAFGFAIGGVFGAIGGASSALIKNTLTVDTDKHFE